MSAQPEQLLSRYRILEKIGEGGMGVVHRARDMRLERDVALKVLGAGLSTDEMARRRFRKEALTLSRLNHPYIATVYDFDRENDVDVLVMEYVPGETLDDKLTGDPLPLDELLHLAEEMIEGLEAAHTEGVLHRDLKPGNLRVTPDGRMKILDFGLAKLVQPDNQTTTVEPVTGRYSVIGTLRYMAPERLRGEPADIRSDIYATGAVLYEMATGKPAFAQEPVPALIAAVLEQTPRLPTVLNPCLPADLECIILKCLEKEARHRYPSASELLEELRRVGRASATSGKIPTRPPQPVPTEMAARRACRRGRDFWRQRTGQGTESAINEFQRAIVIDDSFPRAHAGLADAYATLPHTLELYGGMPFSQWQQLEVTVNSKALAAAGRALELDSTLAQAHATKGRVLRWWNMDEGERELRRAIALDSGYVWAHVWYSGLLSARGRGEEAITEAELAVSLEPETQSVNYELGNALARAKRYNRAIAQLEKTVAMDPSWPEGHHCLMFVYLSLDRYEEAIIELRRWNELVNRDAEDYVRVLRAIALHKPGEEVKDAVQSYEEAYGPYCAAEFLAKLGQLDEALDALDRALSVHDENLPRYVVLAPMLAPLHSGPRYTTLVEQLGLRCA